MYSLYFKYKKLFNCFGAALLVLSIGPASLAENGYSEALNPHTTTYCTATILALDTATVSPGNAYLYQVREFKRILNDTLAKVKNRKKSFFDYFDYQKRTGAIIQEHMYPASVSQTTPVSADLEISLGDSLGRIEQLESDLTTFEPGLVSYTRELHGKDEITQYLDGTEQSAKEIEKSISPELEKEFPYWTDAKRDLLSKSIIGSALSTLMATLPFVSGAHDVMAFGNVFWPFIFRNNYRMLWTFFKGKFSPSARANEENQSYYRATRQIETTQRIRQSLEDGSPETQFEYQGSTIAIPNQLAELLLQQGQDSNVVSKTVLDSITQQRKGGLEEDYRILLTDLMYSKDSNTGEPILVVSIRIRRTFVPPSKPKEDKNKAEERKPIFEGILSPGLEPVPVPAGGHR